MTQLTEKVDQLFAEWDKPDSPGCALAVIKDGEISYQRGYGMADLERNVAISPVSVFDIGSTGKQFTALLILMLARQGALGLFQVDSPSAFASWRISVLVSPFAASGLRVPVSSTALLPGR